jgi:IrrE N-terminal-like domain
MPVSDAVQEIQTDQTTSKGAPCAPSKPTAFARTTPQRDGRARKLPRSRFFQRMLASKSSASRVRMRTEKLEGAWTLALLVAACQRKHIIYEESPELTALRGVVATCGQTVLVRVSAKLPLAERLVTLAHELGHVALGHRRGVSGPGSVSALLQPSDQAQELAANIWAAHLLVRPDIYDAARARYRGDKTRAVAETAEQLQIPVRIVRLWLKYRAEHLPEDPSVWMERGA